ncbi:MAG TPA: alpha/beta hydrolase [Steroidobacteraceae bacterium]|jgi:pimeloyl-ACP methyl ester carboxylesterase|nr:alpha/beta hydrolase [Steroidobacteraceae bacterium]
MAISRTQPLIRSLSKGIAVAVLVCAGMHGAFAKDIPSHKVRIEGSGSRTVILEAGLGDTLDVWKDIQPRIADHCARTLAYTRAGYLGSDPAGDGPRDSATVVDELREELAKRNLAPPYVLVGHSLGGLYMQYFARNYPRDVVGLVLVDSTHWNQHMEIDTSANTAYLRGREVTLFMPWIMRREFKDSISAGEQVHESPPAQFVPTIVLSSTVGPKGETPAARALAARMQDEIAADFPGSQHIRVDGAGHYIQRDRPDVVIEAVRRLAGCEQGEPPHAK